MTEEPGTVYQQPSFRDRFRDWSIRVRLTRKLAFLLASAAAISGMATIIVMVSQPSSTSTDETGTLLALLYLDFALAALLGAVVARRLFQLWLEHHRGHAGAGLHIRLVALFGLVAVTPAILVAIFSFVFLSQGLQAWFSTRVSTALSQSKVVAASYLEEHRNRFRGDTYTLANSLNENAPVLAGNENLFNRFLSDQSARLLLSDAVVVNSSKEIMAKSEFSFGDIVNSVQQAALDEAAAGGLVLISDNNEDNAKAILRLSRFIDAYLIVSRYLDSRVLNHLVAIDQAVSQYQNMEKERKGIEITFGLIFIVAALLILLAAVWLGLTLATQMARPISSLIMAADTVRKGDLSTRVAIPDAEDELTTLSRSFNLMTSQLESQQAGLIEANQELDERRRFTETVLSGVTAGVIGLDKEGRIHLPNRSASELLDVELEQKIGQGLAETVPEMADLLSAIIARPDRMQREELKIIRDKSVRTLDVRIASEKLGETLIGFVVTFDDVTELMSAQRKAAWSDVARRIAHEIKNPLTPIQLSAERLKRKYLKEITTDQDTFATCTETIVRQVEEIGRMVDEFSSFARMPQPSIRPENISEICRQAVFLEQNRNEDIIFDVQMPDVDLELHCDTTQVSRALTNLLKNAAESVTEFRANGDKDLPPGRIGLTLISEKSADGPIVSITIDDNGKGLPKDDRDKLTDPYVTTRAKGTGLGLAIVKKIMEDHGGELQLGDSADGGASIAMIFHPNQDDQPLPEDNKKQSPMDVAVELR